MEYTPVGGVGFAGECVGVHTERPIEEAPYCPRKEALLPYPTPYCPCKRYCCVCVCV